ncbi:hypothetical protein ABT224_33785 [Streptomyces sp. NPDC001584]|uniref:hypothetical protein n=1 Tax=Streptomyces sp. NPDC001584 TaxID=3154521 RepID=UPI00332FD30A
MPTGREDPFPLFEEIRRAGPVVSLGPYALVVTGYGECLHILTDRNWQVPDEEWRTARGLASGYVTSRLMRTLPRLNGPQHGAARRLLSGPFTPAALVRLRPMVRELVRTHLDALAREVDQHGREEFVDIVARALPTALMCAVLGLPDTDRTLIAQYSTQTAPLTEPFATPSQITAAEAAAAEFHAYVLALLKGRTRRAGQGLLSRWAATGCLGSDPVDMDEFASHIVFLLGAGVETTSSLFATAVQALEQHPEQGRWLAAHSEAVPAPGPTIASGRRLPGSTPTNSYRNWRAASPLCARTVPPPDRPDSTSEPSPPSQSPFHARRSPPTVLDRR